MNRIFPALALALSLAACQPAVPTDTGSTSSQDAMAQTDTVHSSTFTKSSVTVNEAKSSVTFVGGSSIVDHPGSFEKFDVTIALDASEPQNLEKAQITAAIDLTSVKTDSAGLDGHFQREDFFDTAKFPTAEFRSSGISHMGGDTYAVTGVLTMKGVSSIVTMDAAITDAGLESSFEISRKDFGIAKDSYKDKILDATVPVNVTLVFE